MKESYRHELKKDFDMVPTMARIFVKRTQVSQVGTIIVPKEAQKGSMELSEGVVIATGPDCVVVKEGDYILFGRYAGAEITRNDRTLVVMNEEDTIGVKSAEGAA